TKIDSGHTYFMIGGTKLLNKHLSGTTDLPEDQFLKLVQLRAGMMVSEEEWCFHCQSQKNMMHILNGCSYQENKADQTRRHNKILDAIISCFANSEMKVHKTPRIYHDNQDYLIPDLLL